MIEKTAVILAGGKNSRMNYKNKSFLKYNGQSFINRTLNSVSGFKEKIIVSNNPAEYKFKDIKVVEDIIPGHGPLSGIHSGIYNAAYFYSLVIACDMPFVAQEFLEFIAEFSAGYDVVVPAPDDYMQPLCAVYSKNCLPFIEESIKKYNRKIISFYPRVKVKKIQNKELRNFSDIDYMFKNINTPDEYKNLTNS